MIVNLGISGLVRCSQSLIPRFRLLVVYIATSHMHTNKTQIGYFSRIKPRYMITCYNVGSHAAATTQYADLLSFATDQSPQLQPDAGESIR